MKQEVLLGIDTIEVVIDTQTILNKNNITFYSSNGNEVGKLVHRQGKKRGYNLILNLPRCVRQNNIQPFSVLDWIFRRVSGFKMGRFSFRRERAIFCYK